MIEPRHVLIVTHGSPKPGCEQAALQVQTRLIAHLEELRAAGRIDDAHAYSVLTGNRATRMGMAIVEGNREAINDLFWSKEWKTLMAQAGSLADHVQTEFGVGGEPASLAGPASGYFEAISALAR